MLISPFLPRIDVPILFRPYSLIKSPTEKMRMYMGIDLKKMVSDGCIDLK